MVSEVILGRKLSALAPSSQSKADRSTAGSAVRPGRSRRSNTDSAKMPSTLQAHVSPPIGWLMLNREGDRPRPDASTTASPPTSTMSPWGTGRAIFSNAKSHFPPSPHLKNEKGTMRTLHKSDWAIWTRRYAKYLLGDVNIWDGWFSVAVQSAYLGRIQSEAGPEGLYSERTV